MKFLIITHAQHKFWEGKFFAYAPYVLEMNLWLKHVEEVIVVAPLANNSAPATIEKSYEHKSIRFVSVSSFSFVSLRTQLHALASIPSIFLAILNAMRQADHIHLRCPGNIGMLGVIAQLFFPSKLKTVKYAGNWDTYRGQPFSYVLQKAIVSSEIFSRNLKVLAYGQWPRQSANVVPFFTATYSENEKAPFFVRNLLDSIEFIFVGTLTSNKNPMAAIQLVQAVRRNKPALLHIVGDGPERERMERYCQSAGLSSSVSFYGNLAAGQVKSLYRQSHFSILLSDSEGWPKAIAEAMFWGCVPIATAVSCVPWMLDHGKRGILAAKDKLEEASSAVLEVVNAPENYNVMSREAFSWSSSWTLEKFESSIIPLLTKPR